MCRVIGSAGTRDLRVLWWDEEGNEIETIVPSRVEVCPHCGGQGRQVPRSFGDVTDLIREDPDFGEEYFAGAYDVTCVECRGLRVVREIDLPAAEKSGDAEVLGGARRARQLERDRVGGCPHALLRIRWLLLVATHGALRRRRDDDDSAEDSSRAYRGDRAGASEGR